MEIKVIDLIRDKINIGVEHKGNILQFIGNSFNNIFEAECKQNTFIRGCYNSHFLWNSYNNLFHENVAYTSGSIYNYIAPIGNTSFSTTITKSIHKVNEATILSYLDPITYSHQVIILK